MLLPETTSLRLQRQLEALPLLLAGPSPDALRRRPAGGGWSALDNVAHLARYQHVFAERLETMLRGGSPAFARYRAEDDDAWPSWRGRELPGLLDDLRTTRAALCARTAALSGDDLGRTGIHPVFGEMAIPLWLEFFLVHEAHHLYVLFGRAHGSAR